MKLNSVPCVRRSLSAMLKHLVMDCLLHLMYPKLYSIILSVILYSNHVLYQSRFRNVWLASRK